MLIDFIDFLLPRFCLHCKIKLNDNEKYLCKECNNSLHRISIPLSSLNKIESLSDYRTLYLFEKEMPVQSLIHNLKYNGIFRIGIYLGKTMGEEYKNIFMNEWHIDSIVPVPLYHSKQAERGYNQSYYIAKGIKSATGINVSKVLKRIRYTQSQTELTLSERMLNVKGAFKIKRFKKVTGKSLLLVDDVITTGSTVNECASVLLEAGANKVYATSIAVAGSDLHFIGSRYSQ
ncbi:ComF family protein [Melioribacter sp. OK-6-Me]|uniref:ComF family protein n=1 Tax=unclassified Melioribacter TaxID=2627329 RepID=UPI003EDA8204